MFAARMSPQSFLTAAATLTCGLWLCALDAGHCAASERPAADGFVVQSWQTDEGLPGNAVNDVVQDRTGYIWLATIGGLVRFDGVNFKPFASPLIASDAEHNIRALAKAAGSTLLMLPAVGGVVQLKDGQFRPHPAGDGLEGKQLQTLFVAGDGAIWIGMEGGRVRRWQNGKISDFGPANGLNSRTGVSFAGDSEGRVWIGSGSFLNCYRDGTMVRSNSIENPRLAGFVVVASSRSGGIWVCKGRRLLKMQGDLISTVSTNLPWVAPGGIVREMFEDGNQGLWIGTDAHGLYRFADGKFIHVETSQSQIASIAQDGEGDIWVGTLGGGINRLRPKLFHLYDSRAGLPEDVSDGVCADERGDVWLANRRGGVARISDGKVSIPQLSGPHKFRAYSVCADDRGWLWASEGGLYRFPRDNPDQVQTVSNGLTGNILGAHVLFKSRQGDIWVGADMNVLGCFRGGLPENYAAQTQFPGQRPRCIAEDSNGRIWVGTEDRQLIELADGKFTVFTEKDGLPDAPIRSLCADADGAVWIGTIGGGLVLRRNGKFTLITSTNGLSSDFIAEMVEDGAGRLWCGTRDGIFHVAKRDLLDFADGKISSVSAVAFGRSQGLAGISCFGSAQPMACKTPDGRLWFATQQGLLSVDAAALKSSPRSPPAFIDGIFVNDRPLAIASSLQVPPLCRKMEFQFSVLSYAVPHDVRIRYRLDGIDSDWVEIVNQRAAVYSALPPGKYCLHLKACNNDGVWNDAETVLLFAVQPAWWQGWQFQVSALMVFLTASALGIRHWSQRRLKLKLERLEHQQALEKERMRIARDLHDDLGATIMQVGLMLEESRDTLFSVEEIKEQSAAISGRVLTLARDLDAVIWSVNPANDSLARLFAYLGQTFLEFFHRTAIRPRLDMMEDVPDFALEPEVRYHLFLMVKEAMDNVIKHSQAAEVTLVLKVVDNTLEIRIEDNGRGFSPAAIVQSRRHGLSHIRARAGQLGGGLEVSSEPGKGTSIHILIPSWKNLHAAPLRHE